MESSPETPTVILDAAEEAFADAGFAGARVNAIAKAAGVNKAMLYYYFESKEGLYGAVLERAFGQIAAVVAAELDHEGPDIRAFMRGYRGVIRSHPNLARLMARDLADGGENVARVLAPKLQGIIGTAVGAVGEGQRSGRFNPDVNPMVVMPVLISPFVLFALVSPVLSAATGVPVEMLETNFDATAEEVILNGLLARSEVS